RHPFCYRVFAPGWPAASQSTSSAARNREFILFLNIGTYNPTIGLPIANLKTKQGYRPVNDFSSAGRSFTPAIVFSRLTPCRIKHKKQQQERSNQLN
ncbi:TPA: hypothetical protein ACGQTK_002055, partial [Klebsiella quasipneumoniae]